VSSVNVHGPRRAILYARVSTDEQARSGFSLAQQLEALREYAIREGYEILEGVSDPGQSGASLERPGMDRVRDLVAAGGVSVVLAQDRDRFAREPAYHYLLSREFEEHGTKVRALNDKGDDSPEGGSPMAFSISSPSTSGPRLPREPDAESCGRPSRARSSRGVAPTTGSSSTTLAAAMRSTNIPCPLCGAFFEWPAWTDFP